MLAAAAGRQIGRSADQLLALEAQLPELELVMPSSYWRPRWTGTPDVVVIGTAVSLGEVGRSGRLMAGFTTDGRQVEVPLGPPKAYPVLAIQARQTEFGDDPETRRRSAPRHARETISTFRSEFLDRRVGTCDTLATAPCVAATMPLPRPSLSAASMTDPQGASLPAHMTWAYCMNPETRDPDHDLDGIRDECEAAMAQAFAPSLLISSDDGNPAREPYWAIARDPNTPNVVRIFYALAYHRDEGEPQTGIKDHWGDSEFIVVEIVPNGDNFTTNWVLDWVFLSAHFGDEWAESSEWVHHSNLWFYNNVLRKNPEVWVAEDKHANYRSQASCEWGGVWGSDECDGTYLKYPPMTLDANWNLGNQFQFANADALGSLYPIGTWLLKCRTSRLGLPGQECFWDDDDDHFAGWSGLTTAQTSEDNLAGPYWVSLKAFFF